MVGPPAWPEDTLLEVCPACEERAYLHPRGGETVTEALLRPHAEREPWWRDRMTRGLAMAWLAGALGLLATVLGPCVAS